MKGWKNEQGFLLMETLLICLVILSLSGVFLAYRLSGQMYRVNRSRITALYLAQEQMAYAVELGAEGNLKSGELPWLKGDQKLSVNGQTYCAHTESTEEAGEGFYLVKVTLEWDQFGKKKEMELHRVVRNHGKRG